jgi:hypothetical protein
MTDMAKTVYISIFILAGLVCVTCEPEDPYSYNIETQEGYPNVLTGTWKAVDYIVLENAFVPIDNSKGYDLVTSLDPNNKDRLILDNVYNSNLRVSAVIDRVRNIFYVNRGKQLEDVNAQFDVETISVFGLYRTENEIGEFLRIQTGLYDQYGDLYDTVIIFGIRNTGFEDVEEYEFEFLFENMNKIEKE